MCCFQDKVSSVVNPRNLISEALVIHSLSHLFCVLTLQWSGQSTEKDIAIRDRKEIRLIR